MRKNQETKEKVKRPTVMEKKHRNSQKKGGKIPVKNVRSAGEKGMTFSGVSLV